MDGYLSPAVNETVISIMPDSHASSPQVLGFTAIATFLQRAINAAAAKVSGGRPRNDSPTDVGIPPGDSVCEAPDGRGRQ